MSIEGINSSAASWNIAIICKAIPSTVHFHWLVLLCFLLLKPQKHWLDWKIVIGSFCSLFKFSKKTQIKLKWITSSEFLRTREGLKMESSSLENLEDKHFTFDQSSWLNLPLHHLPRPDVNPILRIIFIGKNWINKFEGDAFMETKGLDDTSYNFMHEISTIDTLLHHLHDLRIPFKRNSIKS